MSWGHEEFKFMREIKELLMTITANRHKDESEAEALEELRRQHSAMAAFIHRECGNLPNVTALSHKYTLSRPDERLCWPKWLVSSSRGYEDNK